MALVTVKTLEGEPIEDVANDIFRTFGVGKKGVDNGVMLLLAVDDRRSRLEVGGGAGDVITDAMSGEVLEAMRPALRQQQYGPAMIAAAQTIGSAIAKAKGVTIAVALPKPPVYEQPASGIPWPLILIGIVFLLFLMRGRGGGGGFLTGMLLGNLLGGGGGYRGGGGGNWGGFGGGDSGGGGFGGFGGGDSGGGGASSSW